MDDSPDLMIWGLHPYPEEPKEPEPLKVNVAPDPPKPKPYVIEEPAAINLNLRLPARPLEQFFMPELPRV